MEKGSGRITIVKAGGAAAVSAAVANSLIYAAGRSAGAEFAVASGTTPTTVSLGQVVATSALAVLVGTLAAVAVGSRRFRWLEAGALLFTIASLGGPLSMGVGTATKVSLAAMHLVAAASWVAWLSRAVAGSSEVSGDAVSQMARA